MTATLPSPGRSNNYPAAKTVDEALAAIWGVQPGTAHQRRFGRLAINHLVADVITTMRDRGELDALAHWLVPIEVAMGTLTARKNPIRDAQVADMEEDEAEAYYHASSGEDTARSLLRASAKERQLNLERDQHLAHRHGINL